MRELKFRVWSEYWEEYATEAELYMDGSVDAIFEDTEGVQNHDNADLVVEFNTGLRDKNGKEIYEGDIFEDDYNGGYEVVKWIDERSAFCLCYMGYERDVEGFDTRYTTKMEVIGNIHENKELLEKE